MFPNTDKLLVQKISFKNTDYVLSFFLHFLLIDNLLIWYNDSVKFI